MRKTILTIAVLALAWIAYLAWPAYDLARFVRAIERGDAEAAAHYINLARVRTSLTEQITEAYLQRTGARPGPLVHGAVASIADPVVGKLISPQAFTELLRLGWPRAAVSEPPPPPDATRISLAGLGNSWQLFAAAEYGVGRYEVAVPVSVPPERAFMLQFRLAQWRWQLAAVRLPESIRLLLADELIKLRPLPQPQRP
jgi:Protein of unknown function (DUF2939)